MGFNIKLNDVISDPPGEVVKRCLEQIGFDNILSLRIGKERSFIISAKNIKNATVYNIPLHSLEAYDTILISR